MNQIIQNLMDFMNPDTNFQPNPLVNILSLTIVSMFIGVMLIKFFFLLAIEPDTQIPVKRKILNYITLILVSITLIILFFPLYNGLRAVLNPEAYRHVFF